MNKAEIKIMTDILSRYKFQDSHVYINFYLFSPEVPIYRFAVRYTNSGEVQEVNIYRICVPEHQNSHAIPVLREVTLCVYKEDNLTRNPPNILLKPLQCIRLQKTVCVQVMGSLVVRASDSRPECLGSMPDATKYPLSTHGVRVR
ncbi:hypothetical protein TNCV_3467021 [Trichonephila clavipes]|nr:hypothetical protein TNCV_3467021 [Trichonephila clavipes]